MGAALIIAPTVDPATRTLRIKAEIDNADGMLRPGLFARMSLGVAERPNVMMVPAEALIQRVGGVSLYRVRTVEGSEAKVERVSVEIGASKGSLVEVRGPIEAGDKIVRRGHGGLASGMVVVVRGQTSSPVATAGDPMRETDS